MRYVILGTFFKEQELMQLQYQESKEIVSGCVHFFHCLTIFLLFYRLVHRLIYVFLFIFYRKKLTDPSLFPLQIQIEEVEWRVALSYQVPADKFSLMIDDLPFDDMPF